MQRLHVLIRPLLLACVLAGLFPANPASAHREAFTPEQRDALSKAQTVLADVIAITDSGPADTGPILAVVKSGLEGLGYTVISDPAKPHDVVFKVKCEQRKTWEGTTPSGGDADLPDSPSRVWKGPACQLNYSVGGAKIKWQKEVRTDFEDAAAAAQAASAGDAGAFAMTKLTEKLSKYDFPILLAGEWDQGDRLLKVLDTPGNTTIRQLKVIALLGEMMNDDALPRLKEALKDKDLAKQAAVALGGLGKESIPILTDMLKNSKNPELQAAAAKGLGQLGGLHGDPSVIPPLLEMLDAPGIDIGVQTEIAWALGKLPDKRSVEPLFALDRKLQKIRNDDPKLKKLKEAVFWSIKQVYTEDQYS